MSRFVLIVLLFGVVACGSEEQESTQVDPVVREQELAKNNVWHKAKLRGVAFRAIGQEPGWLLEIKNGEEILLVTDYGKNKNSYPYVEPHEDQAARKTVFQVNDNTSVLIEGKPCSDTMSGESFEVTVTVTQGGKKLKGCGRALF
jgi:putative lipoprotein